MTRHAAILQAILALGQSWTDHRHEPFDEWQVRADTIAEAIDTVSRTNQEAAFLVYMGKHESGFSKSIGEGEGKLRRGHYYFGYWQVWALGIHVYSPDTADAGAALRVYRTHRGRGTLVDGIRGYGGYKRWSPMPRVLAGRVVKIEKRLDAMTSEGMP